MRGAFDNLLARYRVASHVLLYRRSYAECHTAEVVSRDVGFRPAVPLPAVAILLRALLFGALTCISQGLNGLRLFGNHCRCTCFCICTCRRMVSVSGARRDGKNSKLGKPRLSDDFVLPARPLHTVLNERLD